jgi:hypothetical protein
MAAPQSSEGLNVLAPEQAAPAERGAAPTGTGGTEGCSTPPDAHADASPTQVGAAGLGRGGGSAPYKHRKRGGPMPAGGGRGNPPATIGPAPCVASPGR